MKGFEWNKSISGSIEIQSVSVWVCMCTVVNCEIAFINSMRIGNCGGCFSIYFIYLVPVVY